MIEEHAPGKVNLVLHVGPRTPSGLHQVCSLFASVELADTLRLAPVPDAAADVVICPGVTGPNLVSRALHAFRSAAAPALPPLRVEIEKRIPVAAGMGGGSADAAAALRAANALAGAPLDVDALRRLAAGLGSDVPSQVEPGHAIVTGTGERVVPIALPDIALVLVPSAAGLSTAGVFAEADRMGCTRARLDPASLSKLAGSSAAALAARLENDLEPAALSLRPELGATLAALREAGALGARVTGSGPTAFGVFPDRVAAERAAQTIRGAIVSGLRRIPAAPDPPLQSVRP